MQRDQQKEKQPPKPQPSRNDWKRILGRELIEADRAERERRTYRR